jgi:hypothetical protein
VSQLERTIEAAVKPVVPGPVCGVKEVAAKVRRLTGKRRAMVAVAPFETLLAAIYEEVGDQAARARA